MKIRIKKSRSRISSNSDRKRHSYMPLIVLDSLVMLFPVSFRSYGADFPMQESGGWVIEAGMTLSGARHCSIWTPLARGATLTVSPNDRRKIIDLSFEDSKRQPLINLLEKPTQSLALELELLGAAGERVVHWPALRVAIVDRQVGGLEYEAELPMSFFNYLARAKTMVLSRGGKELVSVPLGSPAEAINLLRECNRLVAGR